MGVTAKELSIGVGEYPVILASLGSGSRAEVLSPLGVLVAVSPPGNGQLGMTQGGLLKAAFHAEPFSDGKRSRLAVQDRNNKVIHTSLFRQEQSM